MNTLVDWLLSLTPHGAPFFDTYAWLINTAIYTTVTALFIILFKLIFKNRIKARWHFLIWGILLIRLVVPVLPSTPISVFNAVRVEDSVIEQSSYQAEIIIPEEGKESDNIPIIKSQTELDSATHIPQGNVSIINIDRIVVFVWLGGTVILLGYFAVIFAVFTHRQKKRRDKVDDITLNILLSCKSKLNINKNVNLYFADTTPMLIGLFKPSIYIPDNLNPEELEAVLIHELCHMKHLDVLWSAIAATVLCLNWYNPVIWISFFMFKRDIELYCDERTLKFTGNKQSYAKLLLKTATKNKYVLGTSSLQSGKSDVKQRIKFLAKYKKITALAVIAVILAAAISVICLTNATDKNYRPGKTDSVNPNISYDYNWATDTLDIYGEGDMNEYEASIPPWQSTESTKKIIVHNGITSLCSDAFSADIDGNTGKPRNGFQDTTRVELPNSVTKIGDFAFFNCISLSEINLPKRLTDIGEASFRLCKSLKSIELPERVTVINDDLFSECEALESVKLGYNTKTIGNFAFSGTKLKEIDIPDTVTKIGVMAFYDCDFTSITIPQAVTFIDEQAFGYSENGKIEGFTIRGFEGSAAEKYAEVNGFKFEAIGQEELHSEWVSEVLNTKISDYYIETDNQSPLKVTKTNDFSGIIDIIITMGQLNPDFTLYDLSQMDNNLYFRKTASDKQPYYCIVEDTEYHDKAYLFFQKPDGYWICRDFIAVDENGVPFDMRNGSEALGADNGDSLLNLIAKVDK